MSSPSTRRPRPPRASAAGTATPTVTPSQTATVTAPVGYPTCQAGEVRASFGSVASGDDGFVRLQGTRYPLSAPGDTVNSDLDRVVMHRTLLPASGYYGYVGLLRWDTSVLPDNATVTAAWLRAFINGADDTDGLSLTAGWYPWASSAGSTVNDWTGTPESSALAGVSVATIVPQVFTNMNFELGNVGQVSVTGVTSLRLHISQRAGDAAPTGKNDVQLQATTADSGSVQIPTLIVCYTIR